MKIGVISDTHIPQAAKRIPGRVLARFSDCQMILHAGDLIHLKVLDELEDIAPTHAVCGNMDDDTVKKSLPAKKIIEAGRFRIGLIHGKGHPDKIISSIKDKFTDVDCIVFGHAHKPTNEVIDGILYFNPGSPTDKTVAPYNSFGIIEVNDEIKGEIIKL